MKSLLTTLFSLLLVIGLYGQESEEITVEYPVKGDYEIGVHLGLYSGIVSENGFTAIEDSDFAHNVGFGINYDYYFSEIWSIKGRINYDPRGAKDNFIDSKLSATYLSIPVMANWHFGKRKRWYLHFGPYIAFLLSADIDGEDVKSDLDSSEIGSDIGIGVKIPVGNKYIFIESDGQNDFTAPGEGLDYKFVRSSFSVGLIF